MSDRFASSCPSKLDPPQVRLRTDLFHWRNGFAVANTGGSTGLAPIEILLTKKSQCDILMRCGCRGENHHCLRSRGEKADVSSCWPSSG